MSEKRISKTQKPYFLKAKESALLAIEVYNKPAIKFRSAGYIALMVIAWTALFHAVFLRKKINPYYSSKQGEYEIIDNDYRHWELKECLKHYWGNDTGNAIRKNLEFFIPLRNKIEHRHIPELDNTIFGECQALLLNFDAFLGEHFGNKYQLRESLSFSLQLFPSGDSFSQAVKANKSLADVKKFIDDYRGMLSTSLINSSQFSFKAFLIQVANHQSADSLPIQYINYDKLTDTEKEEFQKFAVMIKLKNNSILNDNNIKSSIVVKRVQAATGDIKIQRTYNTVDKFNMNVHTKCWKHYKVRPLTNSENPELTNQKYCIYDKAHNDYLYTEEWVSFLIEKMNSDSEYQKVLSHK
jgi:Protein of unknown function (DUF3644)